MYRGRVNGMDLALLGRTLMKLGEASIPTEGIGGHGTSAQSVMIVAADIKAHPGTPVKDVAARTGFPQSKVSACVARLREAGAVETHTDPADRRRTLISPARTTSPASPRSAPPTSTASSRAYWRARSDWTRSRPRCGSSPNTSARAPSPASATDRDPTDPESEAPPGCPACPAGAGHDRSKLVR